MAPLGFCRQIELTNVVAFPQQSKVHLFRGKKNPQQNRLESWLFLLDKSIIALGCLTGVGRLLAPGVLELFPHFEVQPVLDVLQIWGWLYMLIIRLAPFSGSELCLLRQHLQDENPSKQNP